MSADQVRDRIIGVPQYSDTGAPTAPSITADEFKLAFRNHPGGVAVITTDIGDGPVGLTVTSVVSANVEPNILAFSISDISSSAPTIRKAETIVVHLLGSEQMKIAQLCATSGIDRFEDVSLWSRLETGEPYFPSANAWIRGRVLDTMPVGASSIISVEALEASPSLSSGALSGQPLVYHNRAWHWLSQDSEI